MKIGKLNKKIQVQIYTDVQNKMGEWTKDWVNYKKIWASKLLLRNSNSRVLGKENIEYGYRFKTRYRKDITEDMRIKFDGTIYDIKHVNNIDELNMYETNIDCIVYREGVYDE